MQYENPFICTVEWNGNTIDYDNFDRTHEVTFPRGQRLLGSSAGQALNPVVTNPEELLAAAVGTCLMLTFLAVCSRSKINVLSYRDRPEATVELVERRYRVTKIVLKPEVTLEIAAEPDRLKVAMEKAHGNCIVSLSVRSDISIEPTFRTA